MDYVTTGLIFRTNSKEINDELRMPGIASTTTRENRSNPNLPTNTRKKLQEGTVYNILERKMGPQLNLRDHSKRRKKWIHRRDLERHNLERHKLERHNLE